MPWLCATHLLAPRANRLVLFTEYVIAELGLLLTPHCTLRSMQHGRNLLHVLADHLGTLVSLGLQLATCQWLYRRHE